MMQRSPHPSREAQLPLTTNDSKLPKGTSKTSKKNRHRPTSKGSLLVRIIGGTLLVFVVFIYVVGTRHVLLVQSPESSSLSDNDVSHGFLQNHKVLPRVESFSQKPRTLGYYFAETDSKSFVGTERLDPNMKMLYDHSITRIYRETIMTKDDMERQYKLLDSASYDDGLAENWTKMGPDCKAQYDWQETSFPTCNHVMEVDITNLNRIPMFHENHYNNKHDEPLASSSSHSYSALIASGGWRDVWKVENFVRHEGKLEETFVLKTILYEHDYTPRNYDRHRRDAVAMERLTGSKFIMNIYGFCGNSGLFQFADGGDLNESIDANYYPREGSNEKPWTPEEKMVVAYQTASGLADLHNFAKEGVPAVAHTDIMDRQFVFVEKDGVYKLNDFNRARFIAQNSKTNNLCTYKIGNNPGKYRSPEEYKYEGQTEKVDVYSLGNLFFYLLTGKKLFWNKTKKERTEKMIKKWVKAGERTPIPDDLKNTTDPFERTLLKAIERSWVQDPKDRATARELQAMFIAELEKQGVKKDQW